MKAKTRSSWVRVASLGTLVLTFLSTGHGQTQLNLATQGRNVDFTNAPYTKPIRSGTSLPSSCSANEFFLATNAAPGQYLYACIANVWTAMSGQTGLADPGTNGLVKRAALNTTTAVPAPNGTIVGTTDTQTLTGKSIDASEINSGVFTSARMPAFTGDLSTQSGSTTTALTSVFQTPGTFGDATHALQVTVDSKGRVTSLSSLPIVTGLTSAFYQTLSRVGVASTQRSTLNLSSAFTVTDNSGSTRTDVDLATVNATPGTFGSANQTPVITVNAYGQITAVTTAATAGSSNSTNSNTTSINSGALASIPATCSTGALYLASDQAAGQQIYVCSATNSWGQLLSLGGSGALAFTNGALDIVTGVVPRAAATNTFTGSNTFSNGITLASASAQPTCNASTRGLFWFQNNGANKDGLQACVFNGSAYAWFALY